MNISSYMEAYYLGTLRCPENEGSLQNAFLLSEEGRHVSVPLLTLVASSPLLKEAAAGHCLCQEVCFSFPGIPHHVLDLMADFLSGKDIKCSNVDLISLTELCIALGIDLDIYSMDTQDLQQCSEKYETDEHHSATDDEEFTSESENAYSVQDTKHQESSAYSESSIMSPPAETATNMVIPEFVAVQAGKINSVYASKKHVQEAQYHAEADLLGACETVSPKESSATVDGCASEHLLGHSYQSSVLGKVFHADLKLVGCRDVQIPSILASAVDGGNKIFECDVCSKSFSQKGNLIKHQRIHTGEKPHMCDICNQSFRRTDHLTRHMLIHKGMKPYQCDICKKEFRESGSLNRHMFIHTVVKPHSCDICEQKFRQAASLKRHMLIHKA